MVHLEKLKQYYELSYLMYKNLAKIAKDMCFFTKNYKKKIRFSPQFNLETNH